jgi:hypothetical protein
MTVATNMAGATLASDVSSSLINARPRSTVLIWLAAIGSLLLAILLFAAGQGGLLRIAIPAGAFITALVLYLRRPIGFIYFTLWTWFLTPLLRRLVDWRFGFEDQNMVLLAPFLVTAIAGMTLIRERRNVAGSQTAPFYLCMAGISYGFLVGVIRWRLHASSADSLGAIVYGLFMWLAPVLFGLHLLLRWRDYDEQKQAILKCFTWAVLLLGAYGVYQYIAPPPWDRAWLEGLPGGYENLAFGRPTPYEIRVWSTSNSPGTFAIIMLAGLILLFGARTRYKLAFVAVGYLSFLLSLVRTAWLAWFLGMILLVSSYRGALLRRFILGLLLLPLSILPLLLIPEIAQTVQDRVQSMQNLNGDTSFQDRKMMYERLTSQLLDEPSGIGLLNSNLSVDGFALDSGVLQTVFMLGFPGAALFGSGVLLACLAMTSRRSRDGLPALSSEEIAYRAIVIATLAKLVGENVFVNVGGTIFWMCLGLWMSSAYALKRLNSSVGPDFNDLAPNSVCISARVPALEGS